MYLRCGANNDSNGDHQLARNQFLKDNGECQEEEEEEGEASGECQEEVFIQECQGEEDNIREEECQFTRVEQECTLHFKVDRSFHKVPKDHKYLIFPKDHNDLMFPKYPKYHSNNHNPSRSRRTGLLQFLVCNNPGPHSHNHNLSLNLNLSLNHNQNLSHSHNLLIPLGLRKL